MTRTRLRRSNGSVIAGTAVLAALTAGLVRTSAHVLDQYVQATRIDLRADRIDFELDLTPGIEIAPLVFLQIDADRDGRLSSAETRGYARRVVRELRASIDGEPLSLQLLDVTYPRYDEMRAGTGTIRLRAAARHANRPGSHRLEYRNQHQVGPTVYLVNALVPTDPNVTIADQTRDPIQQQFALDFVVSPTQPLFSDTGRRTLTAAACIGLVVLAVSRRRGRSIGRE